MQARRNRNELGQVQMAGCGDICGTFSTYLRRKAKERNLVWDLSEEYLWDLFQQQSGKCALSGTEIVLTTKRTKHGKMDRSILTASLDRIDSTIGYVEGNVQWLHKTVNIMKQSLLDSEFISWCILIVNHANLERSVVKDIEVATNVQRLDGEESTNNPSTSAQHPTLDEEIV